jgi:hypothetical protein
MRAENVPQQLEVAPRIRRGRQHAPSAVFFSAVSGSLHRPGRAVVEGMMSASTRSL